MEKYLVRHGYQVSRQYSEGAPVSHNTPKLRPAPDILTDHITDQDVLETNLNTGDLG